MEIEEIKDRDRSKLNKNGYSDADLSLLSKQEIRALVESINRGGIDVWINDVGAAKLLDVLLERIETHARKHKEAREFPDIFEALLRMKPSIREIDDTASISTTNQL